MERRIFGAANSVDDVVKLNSAAADLRSRLPSAASHVSEEMWPEYDMMIKYYGLEGFMFGEAWPNRNIFKMMPSKQASASPSCTPTTSLRSS